MQPGRGPGPISARARPASARSRRRVRRRRGVQRRGVLPRRRRASGRGRRPGLVTWAWSAASVPVGAAPIGPAAGQSSRDSMPSARSVSRPTANSAARHLPLGGAGGRPPSAVRGCSVPVAPGRPPRARVGQRRRQRGDGLLAHRAVVADLQRRPQLGGAGRGRGPASHRGRRGVQVLLGSGDRLRDAGLFGQRRAQGGLRGGQVPVRAARSASSRRACSSRPGVRGGGQRRACAAAARAWRRRRARAAAAARAARRRSRPGRRRSSTSPGRRTAASSRWPPGQCSTGGRRLAGGASRRSPPGPGTGQRGVGGLQSSRRMPRRPRRRWLPRR